MKKIFLFIAVSVAGYLVNSCKTDFKTIAPYKEMVCVYGLLDYTQFTNTIRINRVFLTDGNATETAQLNDSANFAPGELTVTMDKYKDGTKVNTIPLTETTTTLGSGTFNTNQLLWQTNSQLASFSSGGADNGHDVSYTLNIHNNKTGKNFSSSTNLVKQIVPIQGGKLDNNTTSISMINPTYPVKFYWTNPVNGKTNNLILRFFYQEFATSDTTVYVDKFVDWNLGNQIVTDASADNNTITYDFLGEVFYTFLKNHIPNDPNIWGRKARYIQCIVTVGGSELQLYSDVSAPSNTIVQDKPLYTNISDGVGVFSSRTVLYKKLTLFATSVDKLAAFGSYAGSSTCALKFLNSQGVLGMSCP